jgi:glycosyltransferase involved in cell wall biosynthesis
MRSAVAAIKPGGHHGATLKRQTATAQMALKVLFISNYDKPGIHNTRPEAEMILGLKRRGVDAEVMSRRDTYWGRRFVEAGIPVHDYVPRRKFSLQAIRVIRKVLKAGNYDVVQLFNNPAIVNGIIASIGLPVKVVTYRGQTGNISRWDPVCYLTHLSPRVSRIVCVAEAVRESLLHVVYDPRKLVTIYKGHELQWYDHTEPADLTALGVPKGAFAICCVANNRPRKGADVLVRAAGLIPPGTPIHFLLIGRDMDQEPIRSLVAKSPLREQIHLLGFRESVLGIVAACQASVLPATKREGLPKTVIESMVHGVTPIVTATGGSAELVEDGVSGLVVPPGDAEALARALLRLSADPEATRQMGLRARERIGKLFRLEDAVSAHKLLFEELAGK